MPAACSVEHRLVITGGDLRADAAWLPSGLVEREGKMYVPLSARDRMLASFCGVHSESSTSRLADCTFLEELKTLRNAAVAAAAARVLKEKDPMLEVRALKGSLASQVDPAELPASVLLDMPAAVFGEEDAAPMQLAILADPDPKRLVHVEATTAAFNYIRLRVKQSASRGAPARKRRKAEERFQVKHPGIRVDYRRETLYCMYFDKDGREKSKHMKPAIWSQTHIDQTAEELLQWRAGEHDSTVA